MRKLIHVSLMLIFFVSTAAAQLNTPRPSPLGKISQIIGLTEVKIEYSRPGVKGRKIFGGLVPFGEVWRTGANESTTIEFNDPVWFEGNKVDAGKYALFTIPNEKEWTIIISKDIGWGKNKYTGKNDVAGFKVKTESLPHSIERFTIEIMDMTNDSANLLLMWDKTSVSVGLKVDTDGKVMTQIEAISKNPKDMKAGTWYRMAGYYFDTNRDLNKALEWVNKACSMNNEAYWMTRLKSRIQAKMGDYKGAIETAGISLKQAEKAGSKEYVKFNQEAIAKWQNMK